MQWNRIQHNCHLLSVKQEDPKSIFEEMTRFWRGFASDVLPLTPVDCWDYLAIDVRGIDGGINFYPQHTAKPPFQVEWARLDLYQIAREFETLDESELEKGTKPSEINRRYATMLSEAAEKVELAALIGRADGVMLSFVAYTEDQEPPFLERLI